MYTSNTGRVAITSPALINTQSVVTSPTKSIRPIGKVFNALSWIKVKAKIRYSHEESEAILIPIENEKISLKFKEPQFAITPGQAVVFYDEDVVLGGGIIERSGG